MFPSTSTKFVTPTKPHPISPPSTFGSTNSFRNPQPRPYTIHELLKLGQRVSHLAFPLERFEPAAFEYWIVNPDLYSNLPQCALPQGLYLPQTIQDESRLFDEANMKGWDVPQVANSEALLPPHLRQRKDSSFVPKENIPLPIEKVSYGSDFHDSKSIDNGMKGLNITTHDLVDPHKHMKTPNVMEQAHSLFKAEDVIPKGGYDTPITARHAQLYQSQFETVDAGRADAWWAYLSDEDRIYLCTEFTVLGRPLPSEFRAVKEKMRAKMSGEGILGADSDVNKKVKVYNEISGTDNYYGDRVASGWTVSYMDSKPEESHATEKVVKSDPIGDTAANKEIKSLGEKYADLLVSKNQGHAVIDDLGARYAATLLNTKVSNHWDAYNTSTSGHLGADATGNTGQNISGLSSQSSEKPSSTKGNREDRDSSDRNFGHNEEYQTYHDQRIAKAMMDTTHGTDALSIASQKFAGDIVQRNLGENLTNETPKLPGLFTAKHSSGSDQQAFIQFMTSKIHPRVVSKAYQKYEASAANHN